MEKEIVKSWRNFRLTEPEQEIVHFTIPSSEEIARREIRMLIGLVISDRSINKEALKLTIQLVWKLKGKVIIKEAGANLFIFEF